MRQVAFAHKLAPNHRHAQCTGCNQHACVLDRNTAPLVQPTPPTCDLVMPCLARSKSGLMGMALWRSTSPCRKNSSSSWFTHLQYDAACYKGESSDDDKSIGAHCILAPPEEHLPQLIHPPGGSRTTCNHAASLVSASHCYVIPQPCSLALCSPRAPTPHKTQVRTNYKPPE